MKLLYLNRILSLVFFLSLSVVLFTCSKSEDLEEKIFENPEPDEPEEPEAPFVPVVVEPDKVVSINTGAVVGELYNFWSTRPMINQTRFSSSGFTSGLNFIKPYVKSYNMVRVLGGRTDNKNDFYKGVDGSGNIITDFSGLIKDMRNFMQTGFKPRIVLDNVPWEMNAITEVNTYGNTNPPDDYNIWRQYINAFLQTLIDEFGMNEVKTWRFRVGTEPNYTPQHWNGTKEEFFKHYDITVDEVLKVIPDAIIGPGNNLSEGVATYTTEIIDHCANGTNYATGEKGTQMDFFCISYYEKIDQNTIKLPNTVQEYRTKLNSYPQFSNIPFDIQEFGILRDENATRGLSLSDATEFGASWYATIADLAYDYRITEIYDWGQEIESSTLPQGRRNVTEMFLKMEGGNRLETIDNITGHAGIIPVLKGDVVYLLIYNHNTTRTSTSTRTLYPQLEGGMITGGTNWKMNEWTIDKTNGVMMHELYKDVRAAGVGEKSNGRIYGNRPSDRFEDGWKDVLSANLTKYTQMAKLPKTVADSIVKKHEGKLTLKVDLKPHSVKLIELIPQ
ncbi:GH39 family glycosyl hydrolase [Algibacter sp. R77976]|uniref:GH39 family glycosyl hydrolase n=1 Tax=Algibacter sp. R77976 TaxID=3093873 RepID=UPI0037C7FFB4